MPNMWLGGRSQARDPMARRRILRLGVLFSLVLLAAGCHKSTPAPEAYSGASVIDEERDIINEAVPDSARRAYILAILDRAEARQRQYTEDTAPLEDSLRALFRSYEATDEQLTEVYQAISEIRAAAVDDYLQYQLEIRDITFPNEWLEITGRDQRLIGN
jgi:hypothetical protein